jgi:hypothetical protein
MNTFNEFIAFVKSASEHLSISEDTVFQIMRSDDESAAYNRFGAEYTMVRDAENIWHDAKRFFGG